MGSWDQSGVGSALMCLRRPGTACGSSGTCGMCSPAEEQFAKWTRLPSI